MVHTFGEWLNESLQEDAQIKAELVKHINKKISDLETKHAKDISSASKIIDVRSIISRARAYLINSIPTVMAGLKSGTGGDAFAAGFISFINSEIKKELENVGWVKRNLVKSMLPDQAGFLARAKSFNAGPFITTLEGCLDLGMAVGWMSSTKKYEDQLWRWSNSVNGWLGKNENGIKSGLATVFSNFLYA